MFGWFSQIFFLILSKMYLMLSNNFVDPNKTNSFGEFNQKVL